MRGKKSCCDVLSKLLIYRMKAHLTELLVNFKSQVEAMQKTPGGQVHHLLWDAPQSLIDLVETGKNADKYLNQGVSLTRRYQWWTHYDYTTEKFVEIIIDLCSYEHDKVIAISLRAYTHSASPLGHFPAMAVLFLPWWASAGNYL